MTIEELLKDKTKKAKEKTETISKWLLDGSLATDELIVFAEKSKDSDKATYIEALEYATKQNLKIADENLLSFVTKTLSEKAPRIKWESAKVIANIAQNFPEKLTVIIEKLLQNAEYGGTVVRWATAYALGEILKLGTKNNESLLPKMEQLCEKETENGVKKKYLDAIKKTKKNSNKI
jgi:HEAT repeat protein